MVLEHADHEVQRFMGTHLTLVLVTTYKNLHAWGSDPWELIVSDPGGPFLGLICALLLPLSLVPLDQGNRLRSGLLSFRTRASALLVLVPLTGAIAYSWPGGWFRKFRVQPEVFTLVQELRAGSSQATARSRRTRGST